MIHWLLSPCPCTVLVSVTVPSRQSVNIVCIYVCIIKNISIVFIPEWLQIMQTVVGPLVTIVQMKIGDIAQVNQWEELLPYHRHKIWMIDGSVYSLFMNYHLNILKTWYCIIISVQRLQQVVQSTTGKSFEIFMGKGDMVTASHQMSETSHCRYDSPLIYSILIFRISDFV